jgi:hypothetical protein
MVAAQIPNSEVVIVREVQSCRTEFPRAPFKVTPCAMGRLGAEDQVSRHQTYRFCELLTGIVEEQHHSSQPDA